jgi:hypothetical protein
MKITDLPDNFDLTDTLVELPENVLKQFKNFAGGEKHMYIVGATMGDFFMSPDKKGSKKRRLYPLPLSVEPRDIADWEVVE